MSDSVKLIAVLAAIPVLIFSLYGFLATFEPVGLEEVITGSRMLQRVICGGALFASLGFMAWLAVSHCLPRWRSIH